MPDRCLDDIDSEIKEVHGRTFRKLGSLLIEIVDRKLFQLKGFTNVEDYFNSEAHLPSARQAFRLISATRFSRQLPSTLPQPKSERQVRPLLGRPIEEAKLLWAITDRIASERSCAVDGKLVSKVVKEYQEGKLEGYVVKVEPLLNGTDSPHADDTSNEQQEYLHGSQNLTTNQERRSASGSPRSNINVQHQQKQDQQLQHSPDSHAAPCSLPRSTVRVQNSRPWLTPTSHCLLPGVRPHSALSQVSSSENACSCCRAPGECQVLGVAQQVARVASMLAQAWGCSLPGQHCDPLDPSLNLDPPEDSHPSRKAINGTARSEPSIGAGYGGKVGKVNGKKHGQEAENKIEDHTEHVTAVLQKSYHQLALLVQRMGMSMDPTVASFPWGYWPQTWPTDPTAVQDWRNWYNVPHCGTEEGKEMMGMYSSGYGGLIPSAMFNSSISSVPLATGASSLFGMDAIPGSDDGGMAPFSADGFQFPPATHSEGPDSPIPYSQDMDEGVLEDKDLLLGSPGSQSLSLALSGRKRDRSTDGSRSQEVSPSRRGKTVRFATPEKKKLCRLEEAQCNKEAKRRFSSRRIDEIIVAETLVFMSHRYKQE